VGRPFSIATYILRAFLDGAPVAIGLGLAVALGSYLVYLEAVPLVAYSLSGLAILGLVRVLRPVRKVVMLHSYMLMVRSPVTPLVELGTWKLLLVAERYWPGEYSDFIGMAAFGRAYQALTPQRRRRRVEILWHIERTGPPHLAKAAREFLRWVEAPIRPEDEALPAANE
jgi:hypothetical protein